ncbi:peroxidase 5-like protein [Tanacetum coccineum]
MATTSLNTTFFLKLMLVLMLMSPLQAQQLQVGFYSHSCIMAEFIVKAEGCNASVVLDSTPSNKAEKDSLANNPSLRGFDVIDNAKARIESACPGVVSCADIIAFAARDSIILLILICDLQTGGLGYNVPDGRRDGRVSLIAETMALPPSTTNLNQLTQMFSIHGLTQEDMITLSGAYRGAIITLPSFTSRLYIDFRGLFTSDQTLLSITSTTDQVTRYAINPLLWKTKFAAAMVKMGRICVLTGAQREIRSNCRVINN